MNENSTSYRFSLRTLFLITLACALLLFEWKMWGVASLLGTVTTLVCGAAFVWFFAARSLANSWKVTLACVLFSFGNFLLFFMIDRRLDPYAAISNWGLMTPMTWISGLGIAFCSLLFITAMLTVMLQLMAKRNWSFWFPLLIAFNAWHATLLFRAMENVGYGDVRLSFGSDLIRGYALVMLIFGIAIVNRWLKSLPTTRDDPTT